METNKTRIATFEEEIDVLFKSLKYVYMCVVWVL